MQILDRKKIGNTSFKMVETREKKYFEKRKLFPAALES